MASAHGAGLMLLPIILRSSNGDVSKLIRLMPRTGNAPAEHTHHLGLTFVSGSESASVGFASWFLPVSVHSLGYLLVTAVVAMLVYEKLGVAILRRAWFNLDLVWAVALVATGSLTLVL